MSPDLLLRLAYGFNIMVLLPVLIGLAGHRGPGPIAVLGGGIVESPGLRWLLFSLWGGVAAVSALGLMAPRPFLAVLIFQVIYKAMFLATYVAPAIVRHEWASVPMGPAAVFVIIVIVWPFIIAKALA